MTKEDRVFPIEAPANPHLGVQPKTKRKESRTSVKRGQPIEKRHTISRELVLRLVTWLEQME